MSPVKIIGDHETPSYDESAIFSKQANEKEQNYNLPADFLQQLHKPATIVQPMLKTSSIESIEPRTLEYFPERSPKRLVINT
jgi:hypothetical protein